MRSAAILRRVEWLFLTDVSGQPLGPILKGKKIQEESLLVGILYPWRLER
jgi:hypothetical protein